MKVTLLDTKSGQTHVSAGENLSGFYWAEGNGSCDCNRASFFGPPEDWDEGGGTCNGNNRFLVVGAEPENPEQDYNYTLADLNPGYPEELLAEHGILPLKGDGNIVSFVPDEGKLKVTDPVAMADKFVENLQGEQAAPPADAVEVITLHPDYNDALLGFTANPDMQRAVYSMELMLAGVQTREVVGRQMAMHHVQTVIQACTADLGPRAPVFVDDFEYVQRQKDGGPKIVTPG